MCLVIYKNRGSKSRTYTLLGNLAVADLGLGLFCMPFTIVTLIAKRWVLGSNLCRVNGFMNAFWIPATVFSTTSITVHKYHSLHDPFNPNRAWSRVRAFIAVTWLLSLVCGVGPLIGWHRFGYNTLSSQCGLERANSTLSYSYMIFLAITVYSIPIILNVFSFVRLFRIIRKHVTRLGRSAIMSQSRTAAQKRTVVTFLLIFLSYLISWTPFFIYGLLTVAGGTKDLAGQYLTAAYILGFSNTVHNPVIFAFRNQIFRDSFKEIVLSVSGRYWRKFRTLTNAKSTLNSSFRFSQRNDSGLESAWYVNSDRDSDFGYDNASFRLDAVGDAMEKHRDSFAQQQTSVETCDE